MSHFLFDLVAEVLSLVISKAVSLNLWSGIGIGKNGTNITHLQYADDTIIFCPQSLDFLQNIQMVLILFHLASGLQVNFHKSSLFGINIDDNWLNNFAQLLHCKIGTFPFSYLGLPLGGNVSRMCLWEPIIERMKKKLASWKGGLLSMGGRLTLIKASLSSLPLYFMSLFPIPKGIMAKIITIQHNFFWSGSLEKKKHSI